ncbi:MAG: BMC domain-containing protein, partial [Candidatus Zixiibacteriota bacterium]
DAAFLTLKIEGDLGAVQAAVKAGAHAAEKIGELIAVHIIPRPDNNLAPILPPQRYISRYHPDDTRSPLDLDEGESGIIPKPKPPPQMPPSGDRTAFEDKTGKTKSPGKPAPDIKDIKINMKELNRLTVSELRRIARSLVRTPLKGRKISLANKQQLLDAIRSVLDMD